MAVTERPAPGALSRGQAWDPITESFQTYVNPQPVEIASAAQPVPIEGTVSAELWVSKWVRVAYGATSGALDANDALGDKFVFDASIDGGKPLPVKGRILSIKMVDSDDDTLAVTLHVFTRNFVAAASDAAFTISQADGDYYWVTSQVVPFTDIGSVKVGEVPDVDSEYYAPNRALYCQLSSTGTPNIASQNVMPLVQIYVIPLV